MATLSSKARPLGVATSAQGALADTAVQPGDSPTFASVDINGGTIDATSIGLSAPNIGKFSSIVLASGVSSAMHHENLVLTANLGNNYSYDIDGAPTSASNGSTTQIWLVTVRAFGDATNGFAGVYIITMWGSSTANIQATALSTKATAGNPGFGFARTDPGGGAPHKLQVNANNYGAIRTINAIRL
jgi:hypothetical protein